MFRKKGPGFLDVKYSKSAGPGSFWQCGQRKSANHQSQFNVFEEVMVDNWMGSLTGWGNCDETMGLMEPRVVLSWQD